MTFHILVVVYMYNDRDNTFKISNIISITVMNACMISEMRHNSCFYIEITACARKIDRSCKQDTTVCRMHEILSPSTQNLIK